MTQDLTPDLALVQVLGGLWPGARVEAVRDRRPDPTARAELVAFPDLARLRLLLPPSGRAAAAALHRFSAAASPAQVAARVAATGAFRAGATRLLPQRLRVYGGEAGSVVDHVAAALGRERVQVSLSLGPARVNRKPVLQVFDEHGRSLGFAKVGTTPAAGAVVRAEAAALERLQDLPFRHLRVPRVLAFSRWHDLPVLVQEDLGVRAAPLLRRRPGRPDDAMRELSEVDAPTAGPGDWASWWRRCLERGRQVPDEAVAARWTSVMDTLADHLPASVPMGCWHGDWTSWNCAPGPDGRTLVWDWERFETDVPRGLDPLHYAVNDAVTRHGARAEVILDAVRGPAPEVAAAYLATIATRYLEMSAQEHGHLVATRRDATITALEQLLSGPA